MSSTVRTIKNHCRRAIQASSFQRERERERDDDNDEMHLERRTKAAIGGVELCVYLLVL